MGWTCRSLESLGANEQWNDDETEPLVNGAEQNFRSSSNSRNRLLRHHRSPSRLHQLFSQVLNPSSFFTSSSIKQPTSSNTEHTTTSLFNSLTSIKLKLSHLLVLILLSVGFWISWNRLEDQFPLKNIADTNCCLPPPPGYYRHSLLSTMTTTSSSSDKIKSVQSLKISTFNIRYDGRAKYGLALHAAKHLVDHIVHPHQHFESTSTHNHESTSTHNHGGGAGGGFLDEKGKLRNDVLAGEAVYGKKEMDDKEGEGDLVGIDWGEREWKDRRYGITDLVKWEMPDVIGFQEALTNQIEDLSILLGPSYDWVGVGRDDGKKAGEYVPIFFNRARLELLETKHFWLSKTPEKPGSKGWDAGLTRMYTLLRLRDRSLPSDSPDSTFYVMNTHFDHQGRVARHESGKMIVEKMREITSNLTSSSSSLPPPLVILLGDLNSPEEEEGYRALTGWRYVSEDDDDKDDKKKQQTDEGITFYDARKEFRLFKNSRLHKNSPSQSPPFHCELQNRPFGETYTFTGFSKTDQLQIIDFIMLGDNRSVLGASSEADEEESVNNSSYPIWDFA